MQPSFVQAVSIFSLTLLLRCTPNGDQGSEQSNIQSGDQHPPQGAKTDQDQLTVARTLMQRGDAGDGYMGSNDRQLILGCSNSQPLEQMKLTWPNGNEASFGDLLPGREYVLVEGTGQAFEVTAGAQP